MQLLQVNRHEGDNSNDDGLRAYQQKLQKCSYCLIQLHLNFLKQQLKRFFSEKPMQFQL